MKKTYKGLAVILTIILMFCSIGLVPQEVEAASAKSILKKAYKEMKKSDTIFYWYEYTYKDNGTLNEADFGCAITDTSISHIFDEQEQWHIKSKVYLRNRWDFTWKVEKTDFDNKTPNKYYGKKMYQYLLKNLKNPRIKKSNKTSYVIVGTTDINDNKYKSVEITISKKDKRATGFTFKYPDETITRGGYEHKITKHQFKVSNICYGKGKLKAPKFKF